MNHQSRGKLPEAWAGLSANLYPFILTALCLGFGGLFHELLVNGLPKVFGISRDTAWFCASSTSWILVVPFKLGICRMAVKVSIGEKADLKQDYWAPWQQCGSYIISMGSLLVGGFAIGFAIAFMIGLIMGNVLRLILPAVDLKTGYYIATITPSLLIMVCLYSRCFLFPFFIVDQGLGPSDAIKTCWNTTRGKTMEMLLLLIGSTALEYSGVLLCGIGIVVTRSLAEIVNACAYRDMIMATGEAG